MNLKSSLCMYNVESSKDEGETSGYKNLLTGPSYALLCSYRRSVNRNSLRMLPSSSSDHPHPFSFRPSSVPDLGARPEGEGLLSGLVHPEEGQPAEEPGDQPGAEEGGVCQNGEPAQEGSSLIFFANDVQIVLNVEQLWFS